MRHGHPCSHVFVVAKRPRLSCILRGGRETVGKLRYSKHSAICLGARTWVWWQNRPQSFTRKRSMQADLLACTGEHARCPKKIKEDVSCVLAAVLLKWQPRVKMGRYDPHVLPSQGIRLGWKYVKICKVFVVPQQPDKPDSKECEEATEEEKNAWHQHQYQHPVNFWLLLS